MARKRTPLDEPRELSWKAKILLGTVSAAAFIASAVIMWRLMPDDSMHHGNSAVSLVDEETLRQRRAMLDKIPARPGDAATAPPSQLPITHLPITTAPSPAGPIALATPASLAPSPSAVTIAPPALTVGTQDAADPLEFAFHPSRFADPNRIAKSIGIVSLSADPPSNAGILPAPPPANGPRDLYAEAVRLEKARAFAMSLCTDLQGNVWVGTEDGGVQKYDPSKPPLEAWTQYTAKDGLGDDNGYAVACDQQGRIWVGHLNHGISVFNGTKWQNYEVVAGLSKPDSLSGPLGERIFHITVAPDFAASPRPPVPASVPTFHDSLTGKDSPLSGSVWMCTSAGLAIYFPSTDTWSYLTRTDGLPSDQISCLAFDSQGKAYVGTQSDGLAIAAPSDGYRSWRRVTADAPLTMLAGSGLASMNINDLLVARDGTVYAATNLGMAYSVDKGASWQFVRGQDAVQKNKASTNVGVTLTASEGSVLLEDYCTSVSEGSGATIWVGHREQSIESFPKGGTTGGSVFITSLIGSPDGLQFTGTYGQGVTPQKSQAPHTVFPPLNPRPGLPSPAEDLSNSAVNDLLAKVNQSKGSPSDVRYLADDWTTQGDWVGRYGRQYAVLMGSSSPYDDVYRSAINRAYKVGAGIGPRRSAGDDIRRWLAALDTPDPRSLYVPDLGHRRQAEVDDHGEAYSSTFDGPDLWITVEMPAGPHRVSLYFVNDDGHGGKNRFRDLTVEVRLAATTDLESLEKSAPLATARVNQFWGGVYKQFVVKGGQKYSFHIRRNGLNAILSGVFIDRLIDPPAQPGLTPYTRDTDPPYLASMGRFYYDPPRIPAVSELSSRNQLAAQLWQAITSKITDTDPTYATKRILAYRMAEKAAAPVKLLANWRWHGPYWNDKDRSSWEAAMVNGYQAFQREQQLYKRN